VVGKADTVETGLEERKVPRQSAAHFSPADYRRCPERRYDGRATRSVVECLSAVPGTAQAGEE